ncbi:MAG: S46 family peptidase [Bacteroidota bacterium]|nr:S46 family peptidase [Bacteroidota bacterium]
MATRGIILHFLAVIACAAIVGCGGSDRLATTYETVPQKTQPAALANVKAGPFDGGRMWTFDYPPQRHFDTTYNFKADQQWFDDVRMSALRFASYCSASFVSEDGLVMTNHHCARESIEEVSGPEEHLLENGFWAPTLADERKVPGLYVDQLVEIHDVTERVNAAMDRQNTDEAKLAARDSMAKVLKEEAGKKTNLRADFVTLYNGGKYSLYLYKRYNDVRLVFAPEVQLGYYGGDWDNFTYPRYDLDCSFFRVYDENGKPLKTKQFFRWSRNGAVEGEPVFVIGNPGRTSRLNTAAQLEFNRDIQYPFIAGYLTDMVDVYKKYAERRPDKKEEMINQIFSIANSQKAYNGQLAGLRNEVLMQRRRDFDRTFRAEVEKRPELKAKYGHIWDEIADSRAKVRAVANDLLALRLGGLGMGGSAYLQKAAALVRYAVEMEKPENERGKPYRERMLELTKRSLSRPVSPDPDIEDLYLAKQLAMMRRMLGENDPIVRVAFGGATTPEEAAQRLIAKSVLNDSAAVAKLVEEGSQAIRACKDPLVAIARMAQPRYDAAQAVADAVRARDQVNNTLLGRALFDVYGTTIPPDATFTLRIADGVVKGYEYNGTKAPPHTTFYGLYDRHYSFVGEKDWDLPKRWLDYPPTFNLRTPLNFVSTNDIIGGNSGSPIINRNKEIVGVVFDGNIESLPGDFIFAEDANNRTVSVHSSGILEAARSIFGAQRLVDELMNGKIVER